MVRWYSEAKSVKLPQGKINVSYAYTQLQNLGEVQDVVSESMLAFGVKRGKGNLTVWICEDDNEFRDTHRRLIPLFADDILDVEDAYNYAPIVRLSYANEEVQRIVGLSSPRILEPNLIINNREFSKVEGDARVPAIKHEFCHKRQMDCGYLAPLTRALKESREKYYFLPPEENIVFKELSATCDDISANEIGIDLGFTKEFFALARHTFEDHLPDYSELENFKPAELFLQILRSSGGIVPFIHKDEKRYASKLSKCMDDYLKNIKVVDCVSLRKGLERSLDRVRNPPNVDDVKIVYDEVKQKFEAVSRLDYHT